MSSNRVFVIAELGSNWRFGNEKENARRMIKAAHDCGADVAKMQWVSDYRKLMNRRGAPDSEEWAYKYVHFPVEWIPEFKAEADEVGIEWACTAYLPEDVPVIAPFVKRFKVAAKEVKDEALREEIRRFHLPAIVSINRQYSGKWFEAERALFLHCVSKYPCPVEEISLSRIVGDDDHYGFDGLSDHTGHVLTGAVAVGAGARIIESHVRLHDTPRECPDYGHSLECDYADTSGTEVGYQEAVDEYNSHYSTYVQNIRTAEKMVG